MQLLLQKSTQAEHATVVSPGCKLQSADFGVKRQLRFNQHLAEPLTEGVRFKCFLSETLRVCVCVFDRMQASSSPVLGAQTERRAQDATESAEKRRVLLPSVGLEHVISVSHRMEHWERVGCSCTMAASASAVASSRVGLQVGGVVGRAAPCVALLCFDVTARLVPLNTDLLHSIFISGPLSSSRHFF